MSLTDLPHPAPSFDDPLGLLRACHERIEQHCRLLVDLAGHVGRHGWDTEAIAAADRVTGYFATAGRHHHQDEEQDLFPLLAAAAPGLAPVITALTAEHGELERLWQRLAALLEGQAVGTAFRSLAEEFRALNQRHIQIENTQLLNEAAQRLTDTQQAAIGRAMARRRGLKPA